MASSFSLRSAGLALWNAVEDRLQVEELAARHEGVDGRVLQRHADGTANGIGLLDHVVPRDEGLALGGTQQSRQHADGRRLARAVGAQETEDLAGRDGDIDTGDGLDVPESPNEIFRRLPDVQRNSGPRSSPTGA